MSIKKTLKSAARRVIGVDGAWAIIHGLPFVPIEQLREMRLKLVRKRLLGTAAEKGVLAGPMTGLRYPSFKSHGSTLYPKLLGSYESEIAPWIRKAQKKSCSTVIDIGCAEGYYAVGFAAFGEASKVIAFDIADAARDLCGEMADFNGVKDKVVLEKECTTEWLRDFDFGGAGLVICDCEGAEGALFTEENLPNLEHCDLVIEVHQSPEMDNHGLLEALFSKTHDVRFEPAVSDEQKVKDAPAHAPFDPDPEIRLKLVGERRSRSTGWLIIEARNGK